MSKAELTEKIVQETKELSKAKLIEVLDFIQFLQLKDIKTSQKKAYSVNDITEDLKNLNKTSLIHLEEEFKDYKERYPQECNA